MHTITRRRFVAATAAALGGAGVPLFAQEYPSRPISLVIGTAAGSGADVLVRYLAEKMRPLAGQSVIIENRPGALGTIAAQAVMKAKPDGHTVLVATNTSFAATPYIFRNPPFDPVKDFVAVGTVSQVPFALTVNAKSTATSVAELTAQLRAKGSRSSFGSPTGLSLAAGELYKSAAGLESRQIPYKSMQQALVDLANGDIDFVFVDATTMIGQQGGEKFRALAVSSALRSTALPGLPTMAEAGVAGFTPISAWFGVALPAGTPPPVADRLNAILNQILATEETARFLRATGAEVFAGSRRDMEQFQAREIQSWAHIAKVAKLEPQ